MTPQRLQRRGYRLQHAGAAHYSRADAIRIIPLGGLEEVGRNMTVVEYRGQILIIDMGLRFPGEDTPGIDYIVPNIHYLRERKEQILGIFITHGHYDHIGAIPYLMRDLGNPPIFTTPLTAGMIRKRQEEFPHAPKLEIHLIEKKKERPQPIRLGYFSVEHFHINHNIPDAFGLAIRTPIGAIAYTSDFKFDFSPIGDKPADLIRIAEIGSKGVLVMLSDSTGAEQEGYSLSEKTILDNLDEVFKNAPGRIIVSTFASLIARHQQVFMLSEKYGRRVAIDGYSLKTNVEIARELGYLKIPRGAMMNLADVERHDPKRVTILCTGAQGEGGAVLMRIANKEHRHIRLRKGDTAIFSSSIVPGNERAVQYLRDSLMRQGAQVYHYRMMDLHASGHAYKEDLKLMLSLMKPKFVVPIHGQYSMLHAHAEIAKSLGWEENQIIIAQNGQIIEVAQNHIRLGQQRVPANHVFVDGLGIGDVKEVVLRDREILAKDGMFVIIAIVDQTTGQIRGNPDIISRGFIYLRESQELLGEARKKVKEIIEVHAEGRRPANWNLVKEEMREGLGKFFFDKTLRRPMVLPVIIEV